MSPDDDAFGPAALPPAALDALARGHTIEAIKIVREHTGLSLKDAKALVDEVAGRAAALARVVRPAPPPVADGRTGPVSSAAAAALNRGDKIQAIKQVRMDTGLGLAAAKTLVEQYARGETPVLPVAAPAAPSSARRSERQATRSAHATATRLPPAERTLGPARDTGRRPSRRPAPQEDGRTARWLAKLVLVVSTLGLLAIAWSFLAASWPQVP
ncbi:MAG: ribosomal protein L7/L12 [Gammaproteobacteria bacterium]|nr:ribosomal protein L7/L12 [Gammaproteobacteria bacterium]MCP5198844.1 ribosomal protein L7/L12 [Gammaproteobacteria bacterium]